MLSTQLLILKYPDDMFTLVLTKCAIVHIDFSFLSLPSLKSNTWASLVVEPK